MPDPYSDIPGFIPSGNITDTSGIPGFIPASSSSGMDWTETFLRTAPAVGGSLIGGATGFFGAGLGAVPGSMAGGALGSAIGDIAGQWYHGDKFNPYELGVETAFGAMPPIFGAGKAAAPGVRGLINYGLRQAGSGAVEGAIQSAVATPFQHAAQTGSFNAPLEAYTGNALGGAVMGGALGGTIGGYEGYHQQLGHTAAAPPPIHPPGQGDLLAGVPPGPPPVGPSNQMPLFPQEQRPMNLQRGSPFEPYTGFSEPTQQQFPGMEMQGDMFGGQQNEYPLPFTPQGPPPPTGPTPPPIPPSGNAPVAPTPTSTTPIEGVLPMTVSLRQASSSDVALWKTQGYVYVPGLKGSDGFDMMVRGDVAPVYVRLRGLQQPVEAPAPAPAPVARPEMASAMGANETAANNTVVIPTAKASNPSFLANMDAGGYKLIENRPDGMSIFQKFFSDESGTFDPQQMWANLKRLLGRDPTPEEVEAGMARQPGPDEQTGRVAQFEPKGLRESLSTEELLQYRKQFIEDGDNPDLVREIENLLRTRGINPLTAEVPPVDTGVYKGWDWDQQAKPTEGEMAQPLSPEEEAALIAEGHLFPELPENWNKSLGQLEDEGALTPGGRYDPMRNYMGEAVQGIDQNRPPQMGQQELPLMGRPNEPSGPEDIRALRARQILNENWGETRQPEQLSMEGQMKDAEIQAALQREDATPPEMRDLSEFGPERMEPSFARVEGGGYKASMNVRRGVENITKDYTSPLPGIMAREGLQNALDAADKLSTGGDVRIRLNNHGKTIEIHDNGSGMDDATIGDKLFEAFSTGKEGEEGATGGKGIGSASYIYGGDKFEIESIAVDGVDGLKYRIETSGTPEQFINGESETFSRTRVPNDTPTGTTMKVKVKSEHDMYDASSMVERIVENTRNRPSRIIVDQDNYSTGTPLKDIEPDGDYINEHTFASSKDDKLIGDFISKNRNSDVKVLIPKSNNTDSRSTIDIHYLNNGMYQFTEELSLGGMADNVPEKVLVDIHPLVDDQNELYPFINTREDIKKDIREEVTKFINDNIKKPGIERRKSRVQELYDSMAEVPMGKTKRKSIVFDPGERLTHDEMDSIVRSPVIQQLIQTYDKLIDDVIEATGRTKWRDRLEGVGIVLDPNMHGVHIPNPAGGKSTILINPFIRIADNPNPKDAAWHNTITNLHEAAHVGSEHGFLFSWNPEDLKDPRMVDLINSYTNQLSVHGDVGLWTDTGHGMGFAHRLGEIYAKFGVRRTFDAAAQIESILRSPPQRSRWGKSTPSEPSGYSPEVQRLLQLYTDSRGRAETTEDLLSGTGVKQANRGTEGQGDVPSNSGTDGKRASWEKIKQGMGWGQGINTKKNEFNFIREALALPSAATTTGDFSPPGRQGLSLINTKEFWKAGAAMFKGFTPAGFKQIDEQLRSKPIFQDKIDMETGKVIPSFGKQIGMKLFSTASDAPIGKRAEATASRWLETGAFLGGEKIPFTRTKNPETGQMEGGVTNPLAAIWKHTIGYPIRATNRSFITFLNHLNANRTEFLLNKARDMSIKAFDTGSARPGFLKQKYTKAEALELNPYNNIVRAKEIADFVNTATGHGPLKTHILPFKQAEVSLEGAAGILNMAMFSPGLFASRIRMLNPSTYIMATPFVRKQYMKAALSTAGAWFAFTEMIKQAGGDEVQVNNDITDLEGMTSADFGKVRIGNTRMDAGGGFLQFLVQYARMYKGGYTSSANQQFHPFGEGFQAQTQLSNAQRFMSNKLNPVAKFAYDLANQSQNVPFHVYDRTAQLFVPLVVQDIIELSKEDPSLLPWMAPIALGMGTQTYSKGESVGKLIAPEDDWLAGGGGVQDLMLNQEYR